jgi:hypothetical protein
MARPTRVGCHRPSRAVPAVSLVVPLLPVLGTSLVPAAALLLQAWARAGPTRPPPTAGAPTRLGSRPGPRMRRSPGGWGPAAVEPRSSARAAPRRAAAAVAHRRGRSRRGSRPVRPTTSGAPQRRNGRSGDPPRAAAWARARPKRPRGSPESRPGPTRSAYDEFTGLGPAAYFVEGRPEAAHVLAQPAHRNPQLTEAGEADAQALGPPHGVSRRDDQGDGATHADGGGEEPDERHGVTVSPGAGY